MAAPVSSQSKNKPINADRTPHDGFTGMGWRTQKHFADVKQKMIDYVGEQEQMEYDGMHLHPQGHHHHHIDFALLDGKQATKPRSQPFTPIRSRKKNGTSWIS